MKGKCTRGFGKVEDPKTGEEINVESEFEVSKAVFDRLQDAYPGFEAVSSDETSDTNQAETKTFRCGVEKSDGEPCGREVDSPDAVCWQH
jgi:hypothetical protein